MSLFDKIGEKIAQTGQSAAQKTKNVTESAKLKGLIAEEEKRINSAYQHIGSAYYQTYGHAPDPLFAQLVANINASKEKVDTYSVQLRQIKGTINCQKCGGEVPYGAPFCSSCGAPMHTASAPAPADNGVLCGGCGAAVSADAAFCTGCGSKMGRPIESSPFDEPPVSAPAPQRAAPATAQCPGCGNDLAANVTFCLNCGRKIDG